MVSQVTYAIAAALVDCFTCGILSILFVISMYLLGCKNDAPPFKTAHWSIRLTPVVSMSILLFVVVIAHLAVTVFHLFEAFASPARNPVEVIENVLSVSNITEMSLVFLSGALGDFIIIYRLWIIWGRNRIVAIFPTFSAIGESVAVVGLIYQFIRARTHLSPDFIATTNRWIIGACVFTLWSYKCLLFWFHPLAIMEDSPKKQRVWGDGIMRAAIMVIESAMLYTSWATFFFASYEARTAIASFASTVWPPITGIAIMLINVRVGLSQVRKSNQIQCPNNRRLEIQPFE
ncbi:hypothetical protein BD779DRAFT_1681107 [Infundibulicybe gibba]|nr:hypothetical protein BD779DRAFT_1681107 [Infundibulicybe gibba]